MFLLIFLLALAPHRIVSAAPSITEILFALGVGDQVVGDTTYCNYPEAAKTKPKIGGFTTPNIEAILSLKPDFVFMGKERPDVAQKLGQVRGISVVTVNQDSIDSIYQSIQLIADKIGIPEKGKALVQSIDKDVHQPPAGRGPKPKVLFIVGRTPGTVTDLIAVGHGGFLSEVIGLAGGVNVVDDAAVQYPRISFEEVIHRDPDIIIDMGHNEMVTEAQKRAIKQLWQKYPYLKAVRRDAVYPISADYFVTPGPRVGQAVRDLRRIFSK
jgi:iron complex transport system substrate-binding protein